MKKLLFLILLTTLSGCFLVEKDSLNEVSGTFVYYDYYSASEKCVGDCLKDDQVVYLFKTNNKSFIVNVKNYDLVKVFFDSKKSIPYEGEFKAEMVYNQMKQIDQFKIKQMAGQNVNITAKAKGVN